MTTKRVMQSKKNMKPEPTIKEVVQARFTFEPELYKQMLPVIKNTGMNEAQLWRTAMKHYLSIQAANM